MANKREIEQAAADQLGLSGVGRGVDPEVADDIGHELPDWMQKEYIGAPAVEAAMQEEDEEDLRGAGVEVTSKKARRLNEKYGNRCDHGNPVGSCLRCSLES